MSELSRLRWLCRRGMKELDVVLDAYLERDYGDANPAQQMCFRQLLEMQDPEIYGLLLGRSAPRDAAQAALIELLRGIKQRH